MSYECFSSIKEGGLRWVNVAQIAQPVPETCFRIAHRNCIAVKMVFEVFDVFNGYSTTNVSNFRKFKLVIVFFDLVVANVICQF